MTFGVGAYFCATFLSSSPSPVTTTNTTTSTTFVTVTTAALQTNSDHHQPQQKHSQSRQKKEQRNRKKRKQKEKERRKSLRKKEKNSTKNKIQIIIKRLYITTSKNKNRISSYTTLQNSYYLLPTFIKLKRRLIFIHLPTIKDDQNLLVFNKIICFPIFVLVLCFSFGFIILIRLNYNKK